MTSRPNHASTSLATNSSEVETFRLSGQRGLETLRFFCAFDAAEPDAFEAELTKAQWGSVAVNLFRTTPIRVERTPPKIDEFPWAMAQFSIVTAGRSQLTQRNRTVDYVESDAAFYLAGEPYVIDIPIPSTFVELAIPTVVLGDRANLLEELTATALPPTALLKACISFLQNLTMDLPEPGSAVAQYAEQTILAMLTALIAELTQSQADAAAALRLKITDYVAANLADPDLNADQIALHFGIGRKRLYQAFNTDGTTLARHIRMARLRQAELHLRGETAVSVDQLARLVGLGGPDQLARLFRQQYGLSPSQYRNQHLASFALQD